MILIDSAEAFGRALSSIGKGPLHSLLTQRYAQLMQDDGWAFEDIARFLIVQPGDTLAAVNAALGFPIDENFVDGARFGEPDFCPSWEWLIDHGDLFELAFVLSDAGFGWAVVVPNRPDIDEYLIRLCLEFASPGGEAG